MPVFKYSALDTNGHKKKGTLNIADREMIKSALLEKNLFLLDAEPAEKKSKRRKLSALQLSEFSRELSAMLSSGIPLVKSINIIINRDLSPEIKDVFSEINSLIRKGSSLSEAMESLNGVFPDLMINMIKAGEASGKLDEATMRLAVLYEKEHRLNSKIKNSMTYPIALLIMTIAVMIVIFTLILPKFFKLFESVELPASTRLVIAVGNLFTNHAPALVTILTILVILVIFILKNPVSKLKIDKFLLRIPKIGKLLKIIYTSRFANTLSSLYSSGISVVNAVNIAGGTVGNLYISSQISDASKKIRSGNSLASSVAEIRGFDRKLSSSLAVGEESGKIDVLLSSLSDSYEYEAETAVSKIISFIEPVMIFIMGGLVAFVVISVMQPIYLMYSNIR
jgi:type IV pilus assembly protein PilC